MKNILRLQSKGKLCLLLASKNLAFLLRKNVKFILIILLFLYPIPYTLYPTYAADSTPSADVKAKLDALKLEIASKAAKLKKEVNGKLTNKAYSGVVKSKSSSSLTIATKKGTKIISVDQDTTYLNTTPNKKGAKVKLPSLQTIIEESNIVSLGEVDDTGVLNARRIIIVPPPDHELKTFYWGQILAITDDLITIKTKEGKSMTVSKVDSTVLSTTLKENQIVIIGGFLEKEKFEASLIHIVSQGSMLNLKPKLASPSAVASKSASPSGIPKKKN